MTESLQNKKKLMKQSKLSKKEAGGDVKHVYYFTQPNVYQCFRYFSNMIGKWLMNLSRTKTLEAINNIEKYYSTMIL